MPDAKTRSVNHQYLIRAPPEKVFRAFTDPEWLVKWFADQATLEPRKGGQYSFGWTNGPKHTGTVVEFEPNKTLSITWDWDGVELHGTIYTLSVKPAEGGTEFGVDHSGFPRTEQWADLYGGAEWGWTYFAMNLKSVMETGHDLRAKLDG
jgi:uncharacterized protein YndB with AHSA1/START domain